MAIIRPFKGIVPADALAPAIAALPYDVYSRQEARAEVNRHPGSFLEIDRPETSFPDDTDMYSDAVYAKGARLFARALQEDRLVQDPAPCLYLYALTMDGRTQTGLVACSSVDDYLGGVIRRHENTRADKEQDRIRHVDALSAQTGPIFLAYRDNDALAALQKKEQEKEPFFDFTADDGVRHRGWRIDDRTVIDQIVRLFSSIPATYIADGHHRAASAVRVAQMRRKEHPDYTGNEEFNFFLSVLFPAGDLHIMDYNRIVHIPTKPASLLEGLSASWEIIQSGLPAQSDPRPRKKGEVTMYTGGCWYRLGIKEAIARQCAGDPVTSLDVSLLQDHLLEPVFHIQDPKTDPRISFAGGIRGLAYLRQQAVAAGGAAFAMYPTSIDELLAVADAGRLMPPKSTWFEPKLRSGLFIHCFER